MMFLLWVPLLLVVIFWAWAIYQLFVVAAEETRDNSINNTTQDDRNDSQV